MNSIVTARKTPPQRIPKVIHYCWLSGEEMPPFLVRCIDTWRKILPEYELRLWDHNSFDFQSIPFVKDAMQLKKWAFAADYIRLFALYTEGGIYLDSDVEVLRPFDDFLHYGFFTSHEIHPYNRTVEEDAKLDTNGVLLNPSDYVYWIHIQAAMMGAKRGHPFLESCLAFYEGKRLVNENNEAECDQFIIGPHISKIAERFGYRYHPGEQRLLHDIVIFEPDVFVGDKYYLKEASYAIHHCNGSWHDHRGVEGVVYSLRNRFPALTPMLKLYLKVHNKLGRLLRGVN